MRQDNHDAVVEPPAKQRRITDMTANKQPSQALINKLVQQYIIDSMKPFRTVETESFMKLVTGLCPTAAVLSRKSLQGRIDQDFLTLQQAIRNEMKDVQFVCTTADLWSAQHKSYLGMTAHWINPNTLLANALKL